MPKEGYEKIKLFLTCDLPNGSITDDEIKCCDDCVSGKCHSEWDSSTEFGKKGDNKHYHAILDRLEPIGQCHTSNVLKPFKAALAKLILDPRCPSANMERYAIKVEQVKPEHESWFPGYLYKECDTDDKWKERVRGNIPQPRRIELQAKYLSHIAVYGNKASRLADLKRKRITLGRNWSAQIPKYLALHPEIMQNSTDPNVYRLTIRAMMEDPEVCFEFLDKLYRGQLLHLRLALLRPPDIYGCYRQNIPRGVASTPSDCYDLLLQHWFSEIPEFRCSKKPKTFDM